MIGKNGQQYNIIEITDNTNNQQILERSFKEPVLIYSARYKAEASSQTKSKDIKDPYSFSYLYSGVVISGTAIAYGRKDYHPDEVIDGISYHAENLIIDSMYFSWTKSGGNSYNGVTDISYHFSQNGYCYIPPHYDTYGSYGWPDHYTYGSVTRYSNFSYYICYVPDQVNAGYAKCYTTITLMYNDGSSTTTRNLNVGFGDFVA